MLGVDGFGISASVMSIASPHSGTPVRSCSGIRIRNQARPAVLSVLHREIRGGALGGTSGPTTPHARDSRIHSGPESRGSLTGETHAEPTFTCPKSEEVLASLAAMANEIDPNGFELKRLEREARKLLNVDAVSGYTALGAIASLRGDRPRRTLELISGDAASLTKLGEFTEALEVARRAYARAPADPAVLDGVVSASIFTGHFREACDLVSKWNGANPERPYPPDSPGGDERGWPKDLHSGCRKSWPSPTRPSVEGTNDPRGSPRRRTRTGLLPVQHRPRRLKISHLMDDPGLERSLESVDGSQPQTIA